MNRFGNFLEIFPIDFHHKTLKTSKNTLRSWAGFILQKMWKIWKISIISKKSFSGNFFENRKKSFFDFFLAKNLVKYSKVFKIFKRIECLRSFLRVCDTIQIFNTSFSHPPQQRMRIWISEGQILWQGKPWHNKQFHLIIYRPIREFRGFIRDIISWNSLIQCSCHEMFHYEIGKKWIIFNSIRKSRRMRAHRDDGAQGCDS